MGEGLCKELGGTSRSVERGVDVDASGDETDRGVPMGGDKDAI